jgi:flagellar biosynthesis protein FlhG
MKPLSQMTHYEVLEIPSDAKPVDVERAYRLAQATFADDSLATYSVFDPAEAAFVRERIELAWQVLSDPEQRDRYDASLEGSDPVPEAVTIAMDLEEEAGIHPRPRAEVAPEIAGFDDLEELDGGAFDGARLRRARLRHGIELDKIASVTKINPSYLRFIEDEQFDSLPASVYVRGFVTAYARCVGLDPDRVVPEYMDRLQAARTPAPRVRRGRT